MPTETEQNEKGAVLDLRAFAKALQDQTKGQSQRDANFLKTFQKQFETFYGKFLTQQKDLSKEQRQQDEKSKSQLEEDDDPKPFILEDVSEKFIKGKFPEFLSKTFKSAFPSKFGEGKDEKLNLTRGGLGGIAVIGGLLTLLAGLMTDGPYKGLAKLVGRTSIEVGKFLLKPVTKFISGIGKVIFQAPVKLIKNLTNSFKSLFTGGIAKEGAEQSAKLGGKGLLAKMLPKLAKFLGKIPILGSIISLGFAYTRFKNGDIIGGILDLLSGAANFLNLVAPGVGTGVSLGIDALNAFLDFKTGTDENGKPKSKGAFLKESFKNMGKWLEEKAVDWPVIGPLIRAYKAFSDRNWKEGLKQLSFMIPGVEIFAAMQGDKSTGRVAQNIAGIALKFKEALPEILSTIKNWPVVGPLIKAIESFNRGEFKRGLKFLSYMIPGLEIMGALRGDSDVGKVTAKVADYIKEFRAWVRSQLEEMPVIGSLIRGFEAFGKGKYAEGFSLLGFHWLADIMTETGNSTQTENTGLLSSIFKAITEKMGKWISGMIDSLLESVIDYIPTDWAKQKARSALGLSEKKIEKTGDLVGQPIDSFESADPKGGWVVKDPRVGGRGIQLSKQDGVVAGPMLNSGGNSSKEVENLLRQIALNTNSNSDAQLKSLVNGFNQLVKALETTLKQKINVTPVPIIGNQQQPMKPNSSQYAQQGNPEIFNFRRENELARHFPAGPQYGT